MVGKKVIVIKIRHAKNLPIMILDSLIGFVSNNSIVFPLFSSDKLPIVIIGANNKINHGVNSKKLERLANPESNTLGAGSGKIHVDKLVINKNIPIIK
tara:strand:+ start:184 stop:477 length:294 start_codon:yes stop_codon:yes gene_type:complete